MFLYISLSEDFADYRSFNSHESCTKQTLLFMYLKKISYTENNGEYKSIVRAKSKV
jgi:hypothetical protein